MSIAKNKKFFFVIFFFEAPFFRLKIYGKDFLKMDWLCSSLERKVKICKTSKLDQYPTLNNIKLTNGETSDKGPLHFF